MKFFGRLFWRYITGQHLDGQKRTDATWWKYPGRYPIRRRNWWTGMVQGKRMLVRVIPVLALVAGFWAWEVYRTVFLTLVFTWGPYVAYHVAGKIKRMRVRRVKPALVPGYMANPEPQMPQYSTDDELIMRDAMDNIGIEEVVEDGKKKK
jgi:hypothetical protein